MAITKERYIRFLKRIYRRTKTFTILGTPYQEIVTKVPASFIDQVKEKYPEKELSPETFNALQKQLVWRKKSTLSGESLLLAQMLSHLGHRVSLISKLGTDQPALNLKQQMKKRLIHPALRFSDTMTASKVICHTKEGEELTRYTLGAFKEFDPYALQDNDIGNTHILHVDTSAFKIPGLAKKAMGRTKAVGGLISLDVGDLKNIQEEKENLRSLIDDHVDILILSPTELIELTGIKDINGAINFLSKKVCYLVVLSGVEGGFAINNHGAVKGKLQETKVINLKGTKTAFTAGFLHGITTSESMKNAFNMGGMLAIEVAKQEGTQIPPLSWGKWKKEGLI